MSAWGVKLQTWLFMFGSTILCGYMHTHEADFAPILASWLLMLGAFFGFCDEAIRYRKELDQEGSLNRLPHYDDYQAPANVKLFVPHQEVVAEDGDGGE